MKPIKRLTTEQKEEGITLELIDSILRSKNYSPVMFQKGDEPVRILQANDKEYWVVLPDGSFLKDGNQLVKYDFKTCLIARARYLANFGEKEKKKKVKEEIQRLKGIVDEKVAEVVKNIAILFEWHEFDPDKKQTDDLKGILISAAKHNGGENSPYLKKMLEQKKYAESVFAKNSKEEYIKYRDNILDLQKKGDYDALYTIFITDGLPLLTSLRPTSSTDMDLLKKLFHADKLEDTIKNMKGKSHLEKVAIIAVEREYL